MTYPCPSVATMVPLDTQQIKFLMDMMMGCPLGHTQQYSDHHGVNAGHLYDQLQNCLQSALEELE